VARIAAEVVCSNRGAAIGALRHFFVARRSDRPL